MLFFPTLVLFGTKIYYKITVYLKYTLKGNLFVSLDKSNLLDIYPIALR